MAEDANEPRESLASANRNPDVQGGTSVVPEATRGPEQPMLLGRRRSVIATALMFTLGAGVAYGLLLAVQQLRAILIMLALSLLIALTLDPLVILLQRGKLPRWVAAVLAWVLAVAVLLAPVVFAVQAASTQLPTLIKSVPTLVTKAEGNLGSLGAKLRSSTSGTTSSTVTPDKVVTYVLKGGEVVFNAFEDVTVVALLTLWLLIALPNLTERSYLLVAASRRPAVRQVTTDLLQQVSRFMMANVLTSVLAGFATWAWALGLGIPYPLLLGSLVAVLDLIPTVGSTIGGAVVTLVSLTVGLPTAIATLAFYIAFRMLEDYLIQPRAMRYSVELPGVITVPAVLIGGSVLGIPGALFAVPVALVVRVLVRDVAMPVLDRR